MNAYIRAVRIGLVGLALLGTSSGATSEGAQPVTPAETVLSVRRVLERLPYYGVFDYIVFRVDGGTVYLAGYSFQGRLAADRQIAEVRAREVTGVFEVENRLGVRSGQDGASK